MTNRRLLILGVSLLALGLAGMTAASGGNGWWPDGSPMMWMMGYTGQDLSGPAPIEGAPTVEVHAMELEFGPDRIVVSAEEPLNISLVNDGVVFHDFAIPELGFRLGVQPGQESVGGLGPAAPGEYDFLCTVPGHAAGGMVGILIVEDGPAE